MGSDRAHHGMFGATGTWRERLAVFVDAVKEMSLQTDPEEMVRAYRERMADMVNFDRTVSLSRRDLEAPWYRITRSDLFAEQVDPWLQKEKLPLLDRGFFGELLYGDEPRIVDELNVPPKDPAYAHFEGMRSLVAIPHFDGGHAVNMVVHMRRTPNAFPHEDLPEFLLTSNLFGRATRNLALSRELKRAYEEVDRELRAVEEIQRSLLPQKLPDIPGLALAGAYHTSRRAGGDYYDFFPLPEGRWGILIADVSGHGTPAAVVMAITHAIAHEHPGPPTPPGQMLTFINHRLATRYTGDSGAFVTAFYGIYDAEKRLLTYSSAGHNPPRLWQQSARQVIALDGAARFPMGIEPDERYQEVTMQLAAGDCLLFYTDGITETFNNRGLMFGTERLDELLTRENDDPQRLVDAIFAGVTTFAEGRPVADDRTVLAVKLR